MTAEPQAEARRPILQRIGWLRLVRDACAIAGVAALVLTLAGFIPFQGERIGWGYARDLYAYWNADPSQPYTTPVGVGFAYLYSPAFLQALAPFKLLPFEAVTAIWLLGGLTALWWLGALWMLVIPGVSSDLLLGNINVFLALAMVLSTRWPGTWAFPLLTKVMPGVGMLWLLFGRQWRALALAAAWTAGIIGLSLILQPELWTDWARILFASGTSRTDSTAEFGPLPIRLGLGVALVAAAGFGRRPWLLPVAALVSMPVIWPASLAVLTAIPRLLEQKPAARQRLGEWRDAGEPTQPRPGVRCVPDRCQTVRAPPGDPRETDEPLHAPDKTSTRLLGNPRSWALTARASLPTHDGPAEAGWAARYADRDGTTLRGAETDRSVELEAAPRPLCWRCREARCRSGPSPAHP